MVAGFWYWCTIINNVFPSMSWVLPLHPMLTHKQAKSTHWPHFITHLLNFCAPWGVLPHFSIQNPLTAGNFTTCSIKIPKFIHFSQKVSPSAEFLDFTLVIAIYSWNLKFAIIQSLLGGLAPIVCLILHLFLVKVYGILVLALVCHH